MQSQEFELNAQFHDYLKPAIAQAQVTLLQVEMLVSIYSLVL